jgi:putative OmpL-like beta-barrel porin-2
MSMAEVSLAKTSTADSRGGFRVDLDYGPTQAIVNAAEPGGLSIDENIGQAYRSFLAPAGTGVSIDVGRFVTLERRRGHQDERQLELFARAAVRVGDPVLSRGRARRL